MSLVLNQMLTKITTQFNRLLPKYKMRSPSRVYNVFSGAVQKVCSQPGRGTSEMWQLVTRSDGIISRSM